MWSQNDSNAMMSMNMDMMKTHFHFGIDEVILFDWWKVSTVKVIGLVGVVTELVSRTRNLLSVKHMRDSAKTVLRTEQRPLRTLNVGSRESETAALTDQQQHIHDSQRARWVLQCWQPFHVVDTALFVLHMILSYSLMLVVMTYNVYLCIAVITGLGLGHLVSTLVDPRH